MGAAIKAFTLTDLWCEVRFRAAPDVAQHRPLADVVGRDDETVLELLSTWPSGVRTLYRGVQELSVQQRAACAIGTFEAQNPDAYAQPSLECVALVEGTYRNHTTYFGDFVIEWTSGAVHVPVVSAGRMPLDGTRLWALTRISEDGSADLVYFENCTGPLSVPTYGLGLSGDFARSRLARWFSENTQLPTDDVESEEALIRTLAEIHAPDTDGYRGPELVGVAERGLRAREAAPPRTRRARALTMPSPRVVTTAEGAGRYAAEVMRALGFVDAQTRSGGADGGIDVVSSSAIAQVKMERVRTGAPIVQALYGVASVEGKYGLVFSIAGYTAQAIEFADRAGVACFQFAHDGSADACNDVASALLTS